MVNKGTSKEPRYGMHVTTDRGKNALVSLKLPKCPLNGLVMHRISYTAGSGVRRYDY